jgi:predicted thioesterase
MNELMGGRILVAMHRHCCRTRPDGAYMESGTSILRESVPFLDESRANGPRICAMEAHTKPTNADAGLPMSRISQLMELAAARLIRPSLGLGESSVPMSFELTHAVTGPISGNLRAVATLKSTAGRVHEFLVHVFDESGLIASAKHTRAIVADGKLEGLARRRATRRSVLLDV